MAELVLTQELFQKFYEREDFTGFLFYSHGADWVVTGPDPNPNLHHYWLCVSPDNDKATFHTLMLKDALMEQMWNQLRKANASLFQIELDIQEYMDHLVQKADVGALKGFKEVFYIDQKEK